MGPTTSVAGREMALEGNVVGETVVVTAIIIATVPEITILGRAQTQTLDKIRQKR
jgi:hypothetical protein